MKKLIAAIFLLFALCGAYDYDGTDDHHSVDNINKGSQSFSACAWIYIDAVAGDGNTIIGYGRGTTGGAGRGFTLNITGDSELRGRVYSGSTAYNVYDVSTPTTLSASTWYHVCLTRGASYSRLYIDGTLECEVDKETETAPNSTDDFLVGESVAVEPANYDYWNGRIAHAGYWVRELTSSEITSMADKSTCPTSVQATDLEVFLRLTEDPAVDTSSNAFTVLKGSYPATAAEPSGMPCGAAATAVPVLLHAHGEN
jgi:hypothetical protein